MTAHATALAAEEAVELAHAWAHQLAQSVGARALFIKGPALHRLALRAQRSSLDIDVLTSPDDFARVCDALEAAGWRERDLTFLMTNAPNHSRSFIHPEWPCDIDVHSSYPGFLADPGEVFDLLWQRRTSMIFATVECPVPDRPSSALFLALHSLRSTASQGRNREELAQLAAAPFTPEEQEQLSALAAQTGSTEPVRTVLATLGIRASAPSRPLNHEALHTWRLQAEVVDTASGTARWLQALRATPMARRPAVLRQAIWPSDHDLLLTRPGLADSPRARNAARRQRLLKGIAALPRVVQAAWKSRRQR